MNHDPSTKPAPPTQAPSLVPGLNPQHMLSSQSSFEYNRTAIPGLSFAGNTQPWMQDAPPPASQRISPWISDDGANANAQYPQPNNAHVMGGLSASQIATSASTNAPATGEDDTMEEGELSESGFEDLYEPYLEPGEGSRDADGTPQQQSADDDEDYDPANPASPTEPTAARATWPDQGASTESAEEGRRSSLPMFLQLEAHTVPLVRERSRSYSPYLSPHEVEAQSVATGHTAMNTSRTFFSPGRIFASLSLLLLIWRVGRGVSLTG